MKTDMYTVIATALSLIRAFIGFVIVTPSVIVCAAIDRLTVKALINAEFDEDDLENIRIATCNDLANTYNKFSK